MGNARDRGTSLGCVLNGMQKAGGRIQRGRRPGASQTRGTNLDPAVGSWDHSGSQLPLSRGMSLRTVLSFYLRLDSSTHFLDQASLEVMDALVTTGSVPFSDEAQDQRREVGEGLGRGTKEFTPQPGGCSIYDKTRIQGHSHQRAIWGTEGTWPFCQTFVS